MKQKEIKNLPAVALILFLMIGGGLPAWAADDAGPRSAALGLSGNASFADGDAAPQTENAAALVQSARQLGSVGLLGEREILNGPAGYHSKTWTGGAAVKYQIPLADFSGRMKGNGGRLILGMSAEYRYSADDIDSGDSDPVLTGIVANRLRVRPTLAYGILDQLAIGIGLDVGFDYEQVKVDDDLKYDFKRNRPVTVSPTIGLLALVHPVVQLGVRFDMGYTSPRESVTYKFGDEKRKENFYAALPRSIGGGIAFRLPGVGPSMLSLDGEYTFRTKKDDLDLIYPAIGFQAGYEKWLGRWALRFGGAYTNEQDRNGRDEAGGSAGGSVDLRSYQINAAVTAAHVSDEATDAVGYNIGVSAGVSF